MIFNDPDDDEYEQEDEDGSAYYLGELSGQYWIFKGAANGDPAAYLRLYYDTPRVDVIKTYAYLITYHKERRKNGAQNKWPMTSKLTRTRYGQLLLI